MLRRLAFTLAASWLLASPALAGMEERNYVARRLAAPHHLQVAVADVEDTGGACTVAGEVVRVFAGRGQPLAVGADVSFSLSCGGDAPWSAERLGAARLLEVFLKPGLKGLEAADDGQGMRALEAATEIPAVIDDPALVRELTETMAVYSIDAEAKRNNPEGALALARVADPGLRLRLLAHAAGALAARKSGRAEAAAAEMLAAFDAMPAGDGRLRDGLAALEPLAMGGAAPAALILAARLAPEVDGMTRPSERDHALSALYGARLRSDDVAGALETLAKLGNPRLRRERLDDMAFALKDFSPANPAAAPWVERLLAAAEAQADAGFRTEAVTALCRTAYRAASGVVQVPELAPKAMPMAEVAAKRRHGPSAVLLAVLTEAAGGEGAKARAARWYALAGVGFDMAQSARAEAITILADFSAADRAAAARLLGGKGAASPRRLLELAAK